MTADITTLDGTVVEHHGSAVAVKATRNRIAKKRDLTEAEARVLTGEIKKVTVHLWMMVNEAHERKAYAALGYKTWKDYVRDELQMSEPRSFQLLDQAKIMRELESAGLDVEEITPPPARVVQAIKNDMRGVRRVIKNALKDGGADDPELIVEALRELAKKNKPASKAIKDAVAEAEAAEEEEIEADEPEAVKLPRGMRWCPCCEGSGMVSIAREKVIKGLLKDEAAQLEAERAAEFSG